MRLSFILSLALVFSFFFIAVLWFEKSALFFPSKILQGTPKSLQIDYEEVMITPSDKKELHGWYVPAEKPKAFVVVFHGNAGNISHRLHLVRFFHSLNCHLLLFDYRGYGRSQGFPSEKGLYQDGQSVLDWVQKRRSNTQIPLILYGESLGGAVAIELARNHPPEGLILQGVFTSAREMARFHYPWVPGFIPLSYRFDNLSKIGSVRSKLLLLHGTADTITPLSMGEALYGRFPGPHKTMLKVPHADHNDFYAAGGDLARSAVDTFIKSLTMP